jgi:hypothetical protein
MRFNTLIINALSLLRIKKNSVPLHHNREQDSIEKNELLTIK